MMDENTPAEEQLDHTLDDVCAEGCHPTVEQLAWGCCTILRKAIVAHAVRLLMTAPARTGPVFLGEPLGFRTWYEKEAYFTGLLEQPLSVKHPYSSRG